MQADRDENLLLSAVRRTESLRLQLDAFNKHLAEVDSLIEDLTRYAPTELESFWLTRRLITKRIDELQSEINKLAEE